jgi:hypothetical protein
MAKENLAVIDRMGESSALSKKVCELFTNILSIENLKNKMTGSLEVETQGWTLKEFRLEGAIVTMAYDGENARCLHIKCGHESALSVMSSDIDVVERRFVDWAQQLIEEYIDVFIDGVSQ